MAFPPLVSAALSDIGKKREKNEDAVLAQPEHGLFCVADGMGGLQAGATASRTIVELLSKAFRNAGPSGFEEIILGALTQANNDLLDFARKNNISGTGSTVAVLAFDPLSPDRAVVFHAGDSRVYRVRAEKIEALTRDHSMASALNLKDPEKLPAFLRGLITRAIGLDKKTDLERREINVVPGDLYLLCSDGLTRMLSDAAILNTVTLEKELYAAAGSLIKRANERGGDDNISVVLIKVADE